MPEEMMSIPAARREKSDVTGMFIILAFTGTLSAIALIALLCWWIFPRSPHAGFIPYPTPEYPPPQLQPSPHQDLVRFYRQELNQLNSVGWVDKQKGIVHIPIDQAMREVAQKGIPLWPPAPPASGQGK
jgi:hypothetical protein